MKWSVIHKWYRLFAIITQISIFLMIFIAIYPVAAKDINVENIGNETWSFDGRYVNIEVPVTIKNHGVYDINDLSTSINVKNASATFISDSENLGNIASGTTRTVIVKIPVDLQHIYEMESPYFYHFYHYDNFNMTFTLSLKYLMDTVTMNTYYADDIQWQPLIKEFKVGAPQKISTENGMVIVNMPYTIETASYLWGTAKFDGGVNCEAFSGTFTASFPLGKKYSGEMKMEFNASHIDTLLTKSQPMFINGTVEFAGLKIPLHTTYYWGAPLNDLNVEVLNNGTLHYSFINDAAFGMTLHIKKQYYYNGSQVYESEETLNVNPGESVNRYEPIAVQQPVDKVIITIYDTNTGVYYQKVITL
uniref:Uncharacterized protein n=1 Tax=uncultured euryarchaeote Alv-FOS1 TaxID=337892 RepID=Q3SA98_9EURY|nr:hypothetical protein [uncultured euryarchaeote Alv-FOS1]